MIPTCADESWVERWRSACWTPRAPRSPLSAARSTVERSTVTNANSAATNAPHATTSARAITIRRSSINARPRGARYYSLGRLSSTRCRIGAGVNGVSAVRGLRDARAGCRPGRHRLARDGGARRRRGRAPGGAGAIGVHDRPGGAVVTELRARTPYGSPTRLWVRDRARAGSWCRRPTRQVARAGSRTPTRARRGGSVRRIVIDVSDAPADRARRQAPLEHAGDRRRRLEPDPARHLPGHRPARRQALQRGLRCARPRALGLRCPRRTSRLAIHGYPPAARSTTESAGCVRVPGRALAPGPRGAAGHPGQHPRSNGSP